jgi:lipopolysaccharide biosynthesis protein
MIDNPIKKTDPDFGPFWTVYKREIKLKKICYFAGHSIFDKVQEYVFDYLKRIVEIDYEIIFISSSTLSSTCIERLKEYCPVIIQKTNGGGDDFGAWKIGLSETDYGTGLDALILVNDSVFGPMRSIKEDAERLSTQYDLWGYSINLEQVVHLQSYFLACNKKMIDSGFVKEFWSAVTLIKVKDVWIKAYEIGFSQAAIKRGFTIGAMVDARDLKDELVLPSPYLNYTIAAWKELILKYNFPVIKREVLMKDIAQATNAGWRDVIAAKFPDYPLQYIDDYLEQYENDILAKKALPYSRLKKDIICLTRLSKKVTGNQLCTFSVAQQIAGSLNQPLLCYQIGSSENRSLLDDIDVSYPFYYLGYLEPHLLEQYMYHWNRQNVRGLIIDKDTYNLFENYFENFYCGNIWVVSEENNNIRITYFIRAEKINDIKTPLSDANILSVNRSYINLKCDKEFLDSYHYDALRKFAIDNNLEIKWQESDKITKAQPKGQLTIEFSNYNFHLFSGNREIYFTEEAEDLCNQVKAELNSDMHEQLRIINALEKPIVNLKDISSLYNLCFLHPEYSLVTSPKTSSFIHFYYEDSLYDLLPYIYNLTYQNNHQFFFSISEETSNRHKIASKLLHIFPGCHIQIVKNIGKDIGGKLNLLKLYFELDVSSEYMLLLHDKKSLHSWVIEGNKWRTELFKIAEPEFIHQIISRFKESPDLGIVGNEKWLNNTDFDYNNGRFAFHDSFFKKRLMDYGISITNYQFAAGTMFWIREDLMRKFFDHYSFLEILERLEHGNILDSQEGTETHFLERFFSWFTTSRDHKLSGI